MTRISSLFVASALAVLPIGAFAQQNAAPVKNAAPTSMTTATPATTASVAATPATPAPVTPAPVTGKTSDVTATVTQPAKADVKTPVHAAKTEGHGMKSHDTKSNTTSSTVPTKASIPAKS